MFITQRVSSVTTSILYESHQISKQESEIYTYLFSYICNQFLFTTAFILFAIIVHRLPVCLLFLLFFYFLRSFSGGWHASTPMSCMILSIFCYLLCIYIVPFMHSYPLIVCSCWIISMICLFLYAPADTRHRPISQTRRVYLKKRAHIVYVCIILIYTIAFLLNWYILLTTLSFCVTITAVGVIISKIQNKKENAYAAASRNL